MKIKTILRAGGFIPVDYSKPYADGGMVRLYSVDEKRMDKVMEIFHFPKEIITKKLEYWGNHVIDFSEERLGFDKIHLCRILYSSCEYNALQRCLGARNIVQIEEKAHCNGPVFALTENNHLNAIIRMEYIPGLELDKLPKDQERVKNSLIAIRDIAIALEECEHRNIVHRDIKPSNIIVTVNPHSTKGTLIDFGLAICSDLSALAPDLQTVVLQQDELERRESTPLGTTHYNSPEQARMEKLTPRSDLFSLGSTTFKVITGLYLFGPSFDRSSTVRSVTNFNEGYQKQALLQARKIIRGYGLHAGFIVEGLESLLHPDPQQRNLKFFRDCVERDIANYDKRGRKK